MGKKKRQFVKPRDKSRDQPSFFWPFSEKHEKKVILILCVLAGLRVFVFAAAFPFFNNVDEQAHFDLIYKYAHGRIPHYFDDCFGGRFILSRIQERIQLIPLTLRLGA
jgi:hypothetical protein